MCNKHNLYLHTENMQKQYQHTFKFEIYISSSAKATIVEK